MSENLGFERASSVTLGVVVVLLYAVFVTSVFGGFATYIYRTEWQTSLASDAAGVQDLDNLIFTIKRADQLEAEAISVRAQIPGVRDDLDAARTAHAEARDEVAKFSNLSKSLPYEATAALRGFSDLLDEGKKTELIAILENSEVPLSVRADEGTKLFSNALQGVQDGPSIDAVKRIDQLQTQLAVGFRREATLRQTQATMNELTSELEELETWRDQNKATLADWPMSEAQMAAGRARLLSLGTQIPVLGDSFQRLVTFPTIFLTLIVTIAAGGLGTVVAFSRKYHSSEETASLARLFVNVGEGIAAAIAIFLFSGAGMLAFAQGGAQGAVEISPYTVAFIAFVSGFMAEDAFGAIHRAGKNFFKNPEEDPAAVKAAPETKPALTGDSPEDVAADKRVAAG